MWPIEGLVPFLYGSPLSFLPHASLSCLVYKFGNARWKLLRAWLPLWVRLRLQKFQQEYPLGKAPDAVSTKSSWLVIQVGCCPIFLSIIKTYAQHLYKQVWVQQAYKVLPHLAHAAPLWDFSSHQFPAIVAKTSYSYKCTGPERKVHY